jgi:hypothetical protein
MNSPQLLLAAPQAAGGYLSPASLYNSLGRWLSTTQVNADVPLNNVFPDVTGPQNASQQVDYQCLFVYNPSPSVSLVNVVAWIPSSSVVGALQWAAGADTTVASPYNSTIAPQAGYINSPQVAPSTVTTFVGPSADVSGGAPLNPLAPGMVTALWIRRTAVGSPAFSGARADIQVTYDILGA